MFWIEQGFKSKVNKLGKIRKRIRTGGTFKKERITK
jgi:hypothetical protein